VLLTAGIVLVWYGFALLSSDMRPRIAFVSVGGCCLALGLLQLTRQPKSS
jgi:hypothetical protein